MWALKDFAPATMAFVAGVPRGLAMTGDDAHFVAEFIDSLFPVTPNLAGMAFDAFVSHVDVNGYELERIRVPTLLVHAKDDPFVSYDAAERAAGRIPGAASSASTRAATSWSGRQTPFEPNSRVSLRSPFPASDRQRASVAPLPAG